ncbi:MAG: hypothetical protein WCS62_00845 [Bacilli bacterium]
MSTPCSSCKTTWRCFLQNNFSRLYNVMTGHNGNEGCDRHLHPDARDGWHFATRIKEKQKKKSNFPFLHSTVSHLFYVRYTPKNIVFRKNPEGITIVKLLKYFVKMNVCLLEFQK